jgi:hypothetical protein
MKSNVRIPVGFVLLGVTSAGGAWAASFDINAYCRTVADSVGGSYQIEEACREMEADSARKYRNMSVEPKVDQYCTEVAEAIGGSYQILEGCIEQESASRDRMN